MKRLRIDPRGSLSLLAAALLSLLGVTQAAADLDENCVISVFNRTAPVNALGNWVLPNVPANLGPVRVRATCVEDGGVRAGQSDFVDIPNSGVLRVREINFDAPQPVPARLELTAPVTTLTTAGETAQLTATATFPDGSTADVSSRAAGTTFTVSNSEIAVVGDDGVLTARFSGRVLVSASHEGALAVLRLEVRRAGDSDGDGLPDDFELLNGLDPNNPADAFADADGDGLTTGEEFLAGLDPFAFDSDGDGLSDGEEVRDSSTSPLLFDTDGDGLSDGLEVGTGSDPLDPASFNLAAVLTSIAVEPSEFTISFSTVFSEASRRLRVTGSLVDGTELDLTPAIFDTTFSSSDLTVASFGAEPGRVFAGRDGTAVVTATNGGLSATAAVSVETFAPTALASVRFPSGFANSVDLVGDYALVAAGREGLQVVDVSDLEAPFIAAAVAIPGNANDVRAAGSHAYVAAGSAGVAVVDLSDPLQPLLVGQAAVDGVATDLVREDLVYLANRLGLRIFDVSDPQAPVLLGGVDVDGNARGIDVLETATATYAVIAAADSGVYVVEVSDPTQPRVIGHTHTRPNNRSQAADVAVRDGLAYVADGSDFQLGGLKVIDLTVPSNPVVVGASGDNFSLTNLALERNLAFAADFFFVNAVPIFNVDTETPIFTAVLDFAARFPAADGTGIAVRDGVVALAANGALPVDNGVCCNGALHIGRAFPDSVDDAGVAPTVELVEPQAGVSIRDRLTLRLAADAADDFRVAAVQFLLGGEVIATDFEAPYTHDLVVAVGMSQITLGAVAIDTADNRGLAEEVVVQVLPNQEPVVEILAPLASTRLVAGTTVPVAVQATDDDAVAAVEIRIDGVLEAVLTEPPYRLDLPVPSESTEITVAAIAFDSVGQTATATVTVPISPDQPPTVQILRPGAGAEVSVALALEVAVGAIDDVAVSFVELRLDGEPIATRFSPPFTFELDVSERPGDLLRLQAVAEDVVGQRTISPEVVVTVITEPPVVRFTSPAVGTTALVGQQILLAAVVADDLGVERVVFLADGMEIATVSASPYNTSFLVPGDRSEVRLEAFAFDGQGAAAVDTRRLAIAADLPPEVALVEPAEGTTLIAGASVLLRAEASDQGGIAAVTFLVDGAELAPLTSPPFEVPLTVPSGVTSVTVEARAEDDAGLTASDVRTFGVVADQAPAAFFADLCGDATSPASAGANGFPCTFGGTGSADVTAVETAFGPSELLLTVRVAGFLDPAAVSGVVSFDLDRDPATGRRSRIDELSLHPPTGLGTDLEIRIERGRSVVPVAFDGDSLTLAVPLALLGGGDLRFALALHQVEDDDVIGLLREPGAGETDKLSGPFTTADRSLTVDVAPNGGFYALPSAPDADGDGLSDAEELAAGTDPADVDSDGDGLLDRFELAAGLDPLAFDDLFADPDGDLLETIFEQFYASDPLAADSDGDGLGDGEEISFGSQASLPSRFDSDGDGLGDGEELLRLTDPLAVDSDGDGLGDGEEATLHGSDPLAFDSDGGGAGDGVEVRSDATDPTVAIDDVESVRLGRDVQRLGVDIAVDGAGNVHAVWIQDVLPEVFSAGSRVVYAMVSPAGSTRIAPTVILDIESTEPRLAVDRQGRVHVVWQGVLDEPQSQVYRALLDPALDDQDGTVADPAIVVAAERLSSNAGVASGVPRLALDDLDRLHVVWLTFLGGSEIHYARVGSDGSVEIPDQLLLPNLGFINEDLALAAGPAAEVHVAWAEAGFGIPLALNYALIDGDTGSLAIDATELVPPTELVAIQLPSLGVEPDGRLALVYQRREEFFLGALSCTELRRLRLDPSLDDRSGDAADRTVIAIADEELFPCFFGPRVERPATTLDGEGRLYVTFAGGPGAQVPQLALFDRDGLPLLAPLSLTDALPIAFFRSVVAHRGPQVYVALIDFEGDRFVLRQLFRDADANGIADVLE